MGNKREATHMNPAMKYIGRLSIKIKIFAVTIVSICLLTILSFFLVSNHFFVASETSHAAGILLLIHKLTKKKSCSGLSLKSQELTALFLTVRLYCSITFESDIHTYLDFATLVATCWVIYMMRFKYKSTYTAELDNMPFYYTIAPCALLAILIHPNPRLVSMGNILWAFSVYLEALSVLPQLRVMQNAKMVEPFTAHYVFALGVARFLGFANWTVEVVKSHGTYLMLVGSGYLWTPMAFVAELVQTFILADFCYYYAKSVIYNHKMVSMSIPL